MFSNLLLCASLLISSDQIDNHIKQLQINLSNTNNPAQKASIYYSLYLEYMKENKLEIAGQYLSDDIQSLKLVLDSFNEINKNSMTQEDFDDFMQLYNLIQSIETQLNCLLFVLDDNFGMSDARPIPIYNINDIKVFNKLSGYDKIVKRNINKNMIVDTYKLKNNTEETVFFIIRRD